MTEFIAEISGWIGAICFSVCAIPQVIKCYKQGHAHGVDYLFLWLWFIGEVCMIGYTLILVDSLQLLLNYIFNLLCLVVILKYRYFPTKNIGNNFKDES